MRVLMLNFEYPPVGGGAATANKHLLEAFSKKNIDVDLITASEGKAKTVKLSKRITIHQLGIRKKRLHHWSAREFLTWTRKANKKMKHLLAENTYDLCHAWFSWPPGWLAWRHRKTLPYIVGLRGSDVPGFSARTKFLDPFIFKPLCRRVWKHAKAVIANSAGLRQLAQRTSQQTIGIIPNGVDLKHFTPAKNPGDGKKILCVSRLVPRKGIHHLIAALQYVPKAELTIIGEGRQEKELKELTKQLGLTQRVHFIGYVPRAKIAPYYRHAGIFVLPSSNEGMSNTLLEAIASGLAVIVTRTGGTEELVDGNGTVLRSTSPKAIARAITQMQHRQKLTKMQRRSREIAEQHSWNRVAQHYLEVYRECSSQ